MKRYKKNADQNYEDVGRSKKDHFRDQERKRDKRLLNSLKSQSFDFDELLEEGEWEDDSA